MRTVLLFIMLSLAFSLKATTIITNSISELNTAINSANPGDELVLTDGIYSTNVDINISDIHGTSDNWITIRAETVGGVEITGTKSIVIKNSSYVHVTGFKISQNVEFNCVEIRGSEYARISNCSFEMVENGTKSYWLYIADTPAPKHIRIDHNEFIEKHDEGCFIVVYGPSNGIAQYVQIDHNHFNGHYFTGANGGEAIRFGDSNRQNYSSYSVIEENLFEKCKGDPEVISVKSTNFTVRRNTLRDCNGSITLRHGDSCLVEGNFILNGSGGIRFYGDNQKIIGNYLFNNDNLTTSGSISSARGAIAIGGGSKDDLANGENTYDRPENCIVAYNTLAYNLGKNIDVGVFGSDSYPPLNLTISNNIVISDKDPAVNVQKTPQNLSAAGNIFFGLGGAGDMDSSSFKWLDPDMAQNAYDVYHLNNSSPAIDSAFFVSGLDDYIYDIDGQSRSVYDIGADEFSSDSVKYRPLTPEDVGPEKNIISVATTFDIQNALKNAKPGDRIVIEPGTYTGSTITSGSSSAYFYAGNDGTIDNPIYLYSASAATKSVLRGDSTDHNYVLYITGDYWIVRDLEIAHGKKGIMIDNSNNTQIFNTDVHTIGEEGIHIRDGSSNNLISYCNVYDTGLQNPQFGEGIYIGSDKGKWTQFIKETDNNIIANCTIGPNVTAESIDIKEGSSASIIEYNTFYGEGMSGLNGADSFIDAKGNNAIVSNNIGYRNDNANITDAFQVHEKLGWGNENAFIDNTVYLDNTTDYVVNVSSGSALSSNNIRYPAGNMNSGNVVDYANIPPRIEITDPPSGSQYESGESISLNVDVFDIDGSINKVEFYANDTRIGTSDKEPFGFSWNSVSGGEYTVYAKAIDNELQETSSSSISIIVDSLASGLTKLTVTALDVYASSDDGNVAANAIDGDLSTRWSAEGDGEWIRLYLHKPVIFSFVKIAFYNGDQRSSTFDIQVSDDEITWDTVLENVKSSGTTSDYETFEFSDRIAKYIRYVGHQNSQNGWNSLLEFEVWGSEDTTITSINTESNNLPKKFEIHPNYPNPFNSQTFLSFSLPKAGPVSIKIYDIRGRLIEDLKYKNLQAGNKRLRINAEGWNSGIYLYAISFNGIKKSSRILLLR